MIDRQHLGNAGLHALGLLDGPERAELEREMRFNPALVQAVATVEEIAAAVALTSPQVNPPAGSLARIESRLNRRPPAATLRPIDGAAMPVRSQPLPPRLWRQPAVAVAAGLAALLVALAWRHQRVSADWRLAQERLRALEQERAGFSAEPSTPAAGTGPHQPDARADHDGRHRTATLPPRSYFTAPPNGPEVRLVQDPKRLQAELDRLRADRNARLHPPSGVVDLRIMEMRPPGTGPTAEPQRSLLTDRVGDALARGVDPEPAKTASDGQADSNPKSPGHTEPVSNQAAPAPGPAEPKSSQTTPAPALHLSGNGASASQDIFVDQGMVNLNALNLHPDSQVVHNNFPGDADFGRYGLTRIDSESVWDGQGWVWHRSPDGRSYVGQRVPAGWTPPDPDEPAAVTAPPLRPAPPRQPEEVATDAPAPSTPTVPGPGQGGPAAGATPAAAPWALPVLDQNGQGIFIVQNLPEAPAGMQYVLGGQFSGMTEPVPLGVLPPDRQATDRLSFTVAPGLLPIGYRLMLEPIPGVSGQTSPSRVILQAP